MTNTEIKISIQGQTYQVPPISGIKLIPFLSALGLNYDDVNGGARAKASEDKEAFARKVMQSLADPLNHYKVAFSITQIIPGIDPELAAFRIVEQDGVREQRFTLNLETSDLLQILQVVTLQVEQDAAAAKASSPAIAAQVTPTPPQPESLPETPPSPQREKPRGFGSSQNPKETRHFNGAAARVIKPEEVTATAEPGAEPGEDAIAAMPSLSASEQELADWIATLPQEKQQQLAAIGISFPGAQPPSQPPA